MVRPQLVGDIPRTFGLLGDLAVVPNTSGGGGGGGLNKAHPFSATSPWNTPISPSATLTDPGLTFRYVGAGSTITATMNATQTTLPISTTSGLSAYFTTFGKPQNILVDSEEMLATGFTGLNLTVQRGHNGSTAASHSSGAAVSVCRHIEKNAESRIWYCDFSDTNNPLWTLNINGFSATGEPFNRQMPALNTTVRLPSNLTSSTGTDHTLFVADTVTGATYEVWLSVITGSPTFTIGSQATGSQQSYARNNVITGTGCGDLATDISGGTRAANTSIAAGLITGYDITANSIDHALFLGLIPSVLNGATYVAPATAATGAGTGFGTIPNGTRMILKPGTTKPATGLSPLGSLIWDAVAHPNDGGKGYGFIVGDLVGGQLNVIGTDGITLPYSGANIAVLDALNDFYNSGANIPGWDKKGDLEKIFPYLRIAS